MQVNLGTTLFLLVIAVPLVNAFFKPSTSRRLTTVKSAVSKNPHNFSWQQTMLRIKDPKKSIPFYRDVLGFKLIHSYDFPQWNFSLYFLGTPPEGETLPEPGTKESEEYLWSMKGACLELTHNHGSENDPNFKISNGHEPKLRGFSEIAVRTPDVYAASVELEQKYNVAFEKRPGEGPMRDFSFARDPDGYWIELVPRHGSSGVKTKYTLAKTLLRVKDPKKSLDFYCNKLGMTLLRQRSPFGHGFSIYFLAHIPPEEIPNIPKDKNSQEAIDYVQTLQGEVLELWHDHGTENDINFKYYNGNDEDEPWQVRGFGHIGFLCDDLEKACSDLAAQGVQFKKKPEEGTMRGLAFAYDPDGYWVELIQRKGISLMDESN